MNNKKDNQEMTFEKIEKAWVLFREYYLTPGELSELTNHDVSSIYKKMKNNTLPCQMIDGVKKIYTADIQTQSFLHDCLMKILENINPVIIDENGNKVKNFIYLEYMALVETCARLIHSLRLSFKEEDRNEAAPITRYEILQMRIYEIVENINNGLIDVYQIFEILNFDNEEIEIHRQVVNAKRDLEYLRG